MKIHRLWLLVIAFLLALVAASAGQQDGGEKATGQPRSSLGYTVPEATSLSGWGGDQA